MVVLARCMIALAGVGRSPVRKLRMQIARDESIRS
jgi:hypothetical protein